MDLIDGIKNINFHDAEILNINCDYINERANIKIKLSYENAIVILECNKFKEIVVNNKSPWGEGFYVVYLDIQKGNFIRIEILLNSGDKIYIEAESISLIKDEV